MTGDGRAVRQRRKRPAALGQFWEFIRLARRIGARIRRRVRHNSGLDTDCIHHATSASTINSLMSDVDMDISDEGGSPSPPPVAAMRTRRPKPVRKITEDDDVEDEEQEDGEPEDDAEQEDEEEEAEEAEEEDELEETGVRLSMRSRVPLTSDALSRTRMARRRTSRPPRRHLRSLRARASRGDH
jgi:hypothetical protein